MKLIALSVAALILSAGHAFACPNHEGACPAEHKVKAGGGKATTKADKASKMEACQISTRIEVLGMECQSCADKVTKGLQGVQGVEHVAIDLEKGLASVDYCSMKLKDTKSLVSAVKKAGFDAKLAAAEGKNGAAEPAHQH